MSKKALAANNLVSSIALFRPNRPVVVSTLDRDGTPHLAPFSWCKPVSAFPPMVTLALLSSPRKQHSLINIEREGEFIVNLPGIEFAPQLVQSSYRYPIGVRKAGLVDCTFKPSQALRTPIVGECLAHVECKLVDTLITGDHTLLIAEVVAGSYLEQQYRESFILDVDKYPACLHLGHRAYEHGQIHIFMDNHDLMAVEIPYNLANEGYGCGELVAMTSFDTSVLCSTPTQRDAGIAPLSTHAKSLSCPAGLIAPQGEDKLYFSDWAEGIIYEAVPGQDPLPFADTKGMPSDVCIGPDNDLYVADTGRKALLRIHPDGTIRSIAEAYQDHALLGPLACAVDRTGNVYFTDADGMQPQSANGRLFCLRKNGEIELLLDNLVFPSGLALSKNEDALYLAETFAKQIRHVRLGRDGSVSEQEIIFRHEPGSGPVDLALNEAEKLYVAIFGNGELLVLDPGGEHLETIQTPGMLPTSIAIREQVVYVSDMESGCVIRVV